METTAYKPFFKNLLILAASTASSVLLTVLFIAVFAFIVLRSELSAGTENIGLIVISVIACFAGGFLCGKKNEKRSFLWGLMTGILYFLIILAVRLLSGQEVSGNIVGCATTFFYCAGSGMLGGMLS